MDSNLNNLVLRTDNGRQYIAKSFNDTARLLNIPHEYIKKQTPEDNGDIESFHNSLKTDYIWQNDLESYEDAKELMEYAFNDYNNNRSHFSINYLTPVKFEKQWNSMAHIIYYHVWIYFFNHFSYIQMSFYIFFYPVCYYTFNIFIF